MGERRREIVGEVAREAKEGWEETGDEAEDQAEDTREGGAINITVKVDGTEREATAKLVDVLNM